MQGYYFKTPFASNGDRVTIPLATQGDGSVSFAQGWGPDYQKNLKTQSTAKAVSRQVTNQVLYALTASVGALQEMGGVPEFITADDNGGVAFSYGAGAQVVYKGAYYVSLQSKNTTTPGTGNLWQKVVYKVATASDAQSGTSTDTIITPSVLKTEADRREKVINQSITDLSQTVSDNKTAQDKVNQDTNETIAQNYKDLSGQVTDLSKTVSTNKTNIEKTVSDLSTTVTNNKQTADNSFAAIDKRTINKKQFNGNITLNSGDIGAIPVTGSTQITGTLSGKAGTQVKFIPTNYENFDNKYAATLKQGNNGYWRDNNTGFVCMWGTIPSLANGSQTITFHTAFSTCFSVTAQLQTVSDESTRNLLVESWNATGFRLYALENEQSACYQAFGIISS